MSSYLFIILCFSVLVPNEGARILAVFPVPSISHQVVFRPITEALAEKGHEVIVITTDLAFPNGNAPANLTEIDVHDVSYDIWRKEFVAGVGEGAENNLVGLLKAYMNIMVSISEEQLKHAEIKKLINNKEQKFDLILLEAPMRPALIFSHIFKAPVIQISSFGAMPGNYEYIGAPIQPIMFPTMFSQKLQNLSMWEKFSILYTHYQIDRLYENHEKDVHKMLSKNFGDVPTVKQLMNNVDMLFLNINPIFEGNRPVPPGVVYMGGLPDKVDKELPKELKAYLDSSKNGVIYISFGTNVATKTLSREKVQELINAFSKLPYNVLWKWDEDVLPGITDNIRISKWLPQSDLLKHPNVKVFITQGGTQSTDEAIAAGIPLIGIPMLCDQWYNAEKYIQFKIGARLDMTTLKESDVRNAIETLTADESYYRNVKTLRDLMKDQPQSPLERTLWWIEYVLRHGGAKHLRAPSSNATLADYLELELVLTILGIVLATITILCLSVYAIVRNLTLNLVSKKVKDS